MSNRFNNKRLLYLVAALVVILGLTILIKIPGERSTLKGNLAEFDTAQISSIIIYPKTSRGKAVKFVKSGNKWDVRQNDIVGVPQGGSVQNIFREVLDLKPVSLAAMDKSKWDEFDVTDSLGTRVKFMDKSGKTVADIIIGRISYKQLGAPNGSYAGNNVQIFSYVRPIKEKKVYMVEGMIALSLDVSFDDWRDRTFIRTKSDDITSMRFVYPADSSFTLSKSGTKWTVNSQPADSTAVSGYISYFGMVNGENFRDKYTPSTSPVYQLLIEGNNLLKISVKCYETESKDDMVINSSMNPDVYFTMKRADLFSKILKDKRSFIKKTGKR